MCALIRLFGRLLIFLLVIIFQISDFRYAFSKNTNYKSFDSASGVDYGGMQIANARIHAVNMLK